MARVVVQGKGVKEHQRLNKSLGTTASNLRPDTSTKKKVAKIASHMAYGAAATWYVRTGPTGTKGERLLRGAAAAGLGAGIFKGGPKLVNKLKGGTQDGKEIREKNSSNTHSSKRSGGQRSASREVRIGNSRQLPSGNAKSSRRRK